MSASDAEQWVIGRDIIAPSRTLTKLSWLTGYDRKTSLRRDGDDALEILTDCETCRLPYRSKVAVRVTPRGCICPTGKNAMGVVPSAEDMELARLRIILERVSCQHRYALTLKQLTALLACYLNDEDRTLRTIAARLQSAKPAVSRMLDHLIEDGLIERLPDPRDRRSVLFRYTKAGEQFLLGLIVDDEEERPHCGIAPRRRRAPRGYPL